MTVASASTEARVSYQLFQSSSMRWRPSRASPPPIKSTLSKGRALAAKNTMLRIVARVLIARQMTYEPTNFLAGVDFSDVGFATAATFELAAACFFAGLLFEVVVL
jgi:hypothetical protein